MKWLILKALAWLAEQEVLGSYRVLTPQFKKFNKEDFKAAIDKNRD